MVGKLEEIKVTPKMIAMGARKLPFEMNYFLSTRKGKLLLKKVYRAMEKARLEESAS